MKSAFTLSMTPARFIAFATSLALANAIPLQAEITTTLNRLSDGSTEVSMRNDSAADLVAFAVRLDFAAQSAGGKGQLTIYVDPLVDTFRRANPCIKQATPPLHTNDEFVLLPECMMPDARDGKRPVFQKPLTAGIFADGTTAGNAALLNGLMLRRSNMLLAVELTLETLEDAGNRNVARDQLIGQFKKMAGSVGRWYLPPEQQVGRELYYSIVGKLTSLPAGQPGSAFPPVTFVEREVAMLHQHRIGILQSQPSLADSVGR